MLYRFDEIDEGLQLLPLAARRALDLAGRKLSREGWQSLPLESRKRLVALGAAPAVDVKSALSLLEAASPAPSALPPLADPALDGPPPAVADAFGAERPISAAVWGSLTPLDRYALAKVADRARPERIAAAYAEIVGQTAVSTHVAASGGARMVDVAEKATTHRRAEAQSAVTMSPAAFARLAAADVAKGDVLGTARIAGIMAAKKTHELIPLCHPIALTKVTVDLALDPPACAVRITAVAEATDRTGVEMEALVAASVAALTIYDMLKSIDRGMTMGPTELASKSGGRSGDYRR